MEVFSKGIHRALVPLDSHMENISGVELSESSSSYRMLTQMDVLTFLKSHGTKLKNVISHTVGDLGAITEQVFAVTNRTKVIDAIKCMRTGSLQAIPIIEAFDATYEDHKQLINVKLSVKTHFSFSYIRIAFRLFNVNNTGLVCLLLFKFVGKRKENCRHILCN